MLVTARPECVAESEWGVAPLPGRVAAGRVAVPDGGPTTCQKVRKKLDGTLDLDAAPAAEVPGAPHERDAGLLALVAEQLGVGHAAAVADSGATR